MRIFRGFNRQFLTVVLFWVFSYPVRAENIHGGYKASILENQDVIQCSEKYVEMKSQNDYQDNDDYYHQCVKRVGEKSEKILQLEYQKKLKEITSSDNYELYDSPGAEKQSLRPRIISHFINEQKIWQTYRDSYCQNVILGAVVGDSAFVGSIACTINMNARRVEEIHLMYTPDSSWSNPE